MDGPPLSTITFMPLALAHLPLLHGWLQRPHVREFWDDGERTPEQVQASYFESGDSTFRFVVTLNAQPAGYIQAYPVDAGSEFAAWQSAEGETWGIDLFIGEPVWLGRGQAVPVVQAFLAHLHTLRPALRRVLIDPEVRNARARQVYVRAGFAPLVTVEVEGKALALMELELE